MDLSRVMTVERLESASSQTSARKRTHDTIVYWMSRDQRVRDNWALIYAREQAEKLNMKLRVVFCLVPSYLGATLRQYDFMIRGLQEVEENLAELNIPFDVLLGHPPEMLESYTQNMGVELLITDFSPLKIKRNWREETASRLNIPMRMVDAHNIVPCFMASDKEEYAARTIRPKIKRLLDIYLTDIPDVAPMESSNHDGSHVDWDQVWTSLKIDESVKPVDWLKPGEAAAAETLNVFIESKIGRYNELRNDPTQDAQSNLSPYFHFGHISAQRVALEIVQRLEPSDNTESFLEEMIVRRELTDNYCWFNSNYDTYNGIKDWAKKTLEEHADDPREYIYTLKDFEKAKTHEDLWNAAQKQLVTTGKMHGYMRMYWAKKILEWSSTPQDAFEMALYLNDKYSLDGRDPNGYVGVAWSIGGIHDRAWKERPVYGKIRYMNRNGCARKFDVDKYIDTFLGG